MCTGEELSGGTYYTVLEYCNRAMAPYKSVPMVGAISIWTFSENKLRAALQAQRDALLAKCSAEDVTCRAACTPDPGPRPACPP